MHVISGGLGAALRKHERQEKAFEFLKTKTPNQSFDISEIDAAAGWKPGTAYTNITKYWQGWLRHHGQSVEVLPEFRRVTVEQFIEHSSQKRRPYGSFAPRTYGHVSIFEFLLPLTREAQLRAALDDLFYTDSLRQRLGEIGARQLDTLIPRIDGETDAAYEQRVLDQVEDWFGGYSIRHVAGRFRSGTLQSRVEAAQNHRDGQPYLIDETTAVVTFIVPFDAIPVRSGAQDTALRIRGLFNELFAKAVVRTVEGEEVIWFLEDSPLGRSLHVFEKAR